MLKKWIFDNLYKDEKPDFTKISANYLSKYQEKAIEIIRATSFLDDFASFSERVYCIINDIKGVIECKICKKILKFRSFGVGYAKYCSSRCANRDPEVRGGIEETCRRIYGGKAPACSKAVLNKMQNTTEDRYKKKNPFQVEQFKDKVRETVEKKYNVSNVAKSDEIKELKRITCQERYNSDTPFHSSEIQQKCRDMIKEMWDVDNINQKHISKECLEKLNNKQWLTEQNHILKKSYTDIAKELGVSESCVLSYFKLNNVSYDYFYNSSMEKEIKKFIGMEDVQTNKRNIIPPFELDLYLPDHKLAIEFNGLFWHSFKERETTEQKNKHLTKTNKCKEKGIQLLHIFENEWIDETKQEIWKSIINNKLGRNIKISARKCEIKIVENYKEFLRENHIQGYIPSKINLGLYFQEELVALMCFSTPRFNHNYDWEITRFCCKKNHSVIGGASRLFKYFTKYDNGSIISYADLRYSNGSLYEKLGMEHVGNSAPNYFYWKPGNTNIENRMKYQKHMLPELLENYRAELSESQNMFDNGYRRIWDCGNAVFRKAVNEIQI